MKGTVTVRSIVAALVGVGSVHARQAPAPAAEDDWALIEVIVTANRREESVQKSSLALDVVSGEQLRAGASVAPCSCRGTAEGHRVHRVSTSYRRRRIGQWSPTSASSIA